MNSDNPLVCNMGIFSATQREAHILVTEELIQAALSVQEVENGYQFIFPNEASFISKIAVFVSSERLCCPFLTFTMNVVSNNKPVSLSLTGPSGTQEFLRAEFGGAIQ